MTGRFGRCPVVMLALAGLACGDSKISGADSPSGTYNLQTINLQSIPVIVSLTPDTKLEITGSTLALIGEREFQNTTSFRKTVSGVLTLPSESCGGVYTQVNLRLTFTEVATPGTNCGASYTGVWDGASEIAVDFDPTTHAIYRK